MKEDGERQKIPALHNDTDKYQRKICPNPLLTQKGTLKIFQPPRVILTEQKEEEMTERINICAPFSTPTKRKNDNIQVCPLVVGNFVKKLEPSEIEEKKEMRKCLLEKNRSISPEEKKRDIIGVPYERERSQSMTIKLKKIIEKEVKESESNCSNSSSEEEESGSESKTSSDEELQLEREITFTNLRNKRPSRLSLNMMTPALKMFVKKPGFNESASSEAVSPTRSNKRKSDLLEVPGSTPKDISYIAQKSDTKDVDLSEIDEDKSQCHSEYVGFSNEEGKAEANWKKFEELKEGKSTEEYIEGIFSNEAFITDYKRIMITKHRFAKYKKRQDSLAHFGDYFARDPLVSLENKTLVLNLRYVLYDHTTDEIDNPDIKIISQTGNIKFIKFRPYIIEFLKCMSKIFELIIYSNEPAEATNEIFEHLNKFGPFFSKYLDSSHCLSNHETYSVKDLSLLKIGRDIENILLVDHSIMSYQLTYHNGIPINKFKFDMDDDRELVVLCKYLEFLAHETNMRKNITTYFDKYISALQMANGYVRSSTFAY